MYVCLYVFIHSIESLYYSFTKALKLNHVMESSMDTKSDVKSTTCTATTNAKYYSK